MKAATIYECESRYAVSIVLAETEQQAIDYLRERHARIAAQPIKTLVHVHIIDSYELPRLLTELHE